MNKLSVATFLCVIVITFVTASASGDFCFCPEILIYFPVCGDDGRTYVNRGEIECYNKCHNADVKYKEDGPCVCNCATNRMHLPVCGSDGNSYVNPSALSCHNKCNYPAIKIEKYEKCNEDDKLLHH